MPDREPVLRIDRLTTGFDTRHGFVPVVHDVSLSLHSGETLCLVGESGSGKSLTALSILRVVPPPGRIAGGRILFGDRDLLTLPEAELRTVRGRAIALVFQEPSAALHPMFTVGAQIEETLLAHGCATRATARRQAIELLTQARVPDPERRHGAYAHQLSGGLRQRATIALALACAPSVLIADEPTTALDATVQAEILDLLRDLQQRLGLALLLVTHDLGVVAAAATRVAVMYAGRIVEAGPVAEIFRDPKHPYTKLLIASVPGGLPGTPLRGIPGAPPRPEALPPGCAFEPRCPERLPLCAVERPKETILPGGRTVRCHLHDGDGAVRS